LSSETKELTPEQAVEELRALRDRFPGKPRVGGGLTLKVIAAELGLDSNVTVSWWLTKGDSKHAPRGSTLKALNKFLDRCKSATGEQYLIRITKPKKKKKEI
jgi:hypothetical protein